MTDSKIERATIEEVCDYVEIDASAINGHYPAQDGEMCFGVSMPRGAIYRFLMGLSATLTETAMIREDVNPTEEAFELSEVVQVDSMGRDAVVSFPGWLLR